MLNQLYSELQFDGLWLDMNEISNFCNGVCQENQKIDYPVKNKLPYTPSSSDLEWHTVSLDAYHQNNNTQLDTHSLYGIKET